MTERSSPIERRRPTDRLTALTSEQEHRVIGYVLDFVSQSTSILAQLKNKPDSLNAEASLNNGLRSDSAYPLQATTSEHLLHFLSQTGIAKSALEDKHTVSSLSKLIEEVKSNPDIYKAFGNNKRPEANSKRAWVQASESVLSNRR